jgi:hypothetical protein
MSGETSHSGNKQVQKYKPTATEALSAELALWTILSTVIGIFLPPMAPVPIIFLIGLLTGKLLYGTHDVEDTNLLNSKTDYSISS